MTNDLFGNLGGLGNIFGGLSKGMPIDTPEGKLFTTQSELSDLQKQEADILVEIGRQAYQQNPGVWPQDAKLQLIRQNIESAQAALNEAQQAQKRAEAAKAAEDAKGRCPNCSHKNQDGVKFCQECGTPLTAPGPKFCVQCGAELTPGTRFCGECGGKQE